MQGSGHGGRAGKGGDREARLAAKLRQNLVRRKEKARAISDVEAMRLDVEVPQRRRKSTAVPGDSDKGA